MYIEFIKPGIFTTLQYGEQTGHRAWGMGPGGVMDEFAARCANRMVHNPPGTALLEIHFPAPELFFPAPALIALAGAGFGAENNGIPLANWQTHFIKEGSTLRFTGVHSGFRAYCAVYGGFSVPPAANNTRTPIQKGERIMLNKVCDVAPGNYEMTILPEKVQEVYRNAGSVFCIPGAEWELLFPQAQQQVKTQTFRLSPQSNRMGFRLEGDAIEHTPGNMLSSVADRGMVQLLPSGKLLVLMAGHQTTGGYPRILSVLSPSLPVLAQMKPGATFRFFVISLKEAEEQLISWNTILANIEQ